MADKDRPAVTWCRCGHPMGLGGEHDQQGCTRRERVTAAHVLRELSADSVGVVRLPGDQRWLDAGGGMVLCACGGAVKHTVHRERKSVGP